MMNLYSDKRCWIFKLNYCPVLYLQRIAGVDCQITPSPNDQLQFTLITEANWSWLKLRNLRTLPLEVINITILKQTSKLKVSWNK